MFTQQIHWKTHFGVVSVESFEGELFTECAALVMNIVGCPSLDFNSHS